MNGHSLHKKDYLTLAALAAIPTGAGAMGLGPLAGMMGTGAQAAGVGLGTGLTGAADLAAGGAATPGIASTIAQTGLFGHALPAGAGQMAGMLGRGLLAGSQQQPAGAPPMGPRPGMAQGATNTQLFPQTASADPNDPELKKLLALLQQQRGMA